MKQSRKEIQKLILMFGSAIFAAFVVIAALVYSFSTPKSEVFKDVLISSNQMDQQTQQR